MKFKIFSVILITIFSLKSLTYADDISDFEIEGFSVGESLNASKIAGDLTETNARVISSVEETTKYKFLPEKDLFDVEYWSLEQAKIKKARKILQGNVVVITGGFGAIGSATYKLFKSYGAEIILLDYDSKKVKEMRDQIKDLCLHCDVTVSYTHLTLPTKRIV